MRAASSAAWSATGSRAIASLLGATLLLLAIWFASVQLYTGVSWLTVMDWLGHHVLAAAAWVRARFAVSRDQAVGRESREAREIAVREVKKKAEKRTPPRIEPPAPAVAEPSRRVEKERQVQLFAKPPSRDLPELKLLDEPPVRPSTYSPEALDAISRLVEIKLKDFGIDVEVVAVQPGPVVTRFELKPAPGVKVSQISALAKDLARALSAISVRVVEVIPGKAVVGLEIPNESRELVTLGEILRSRAYDELDSPLALALGKDIGGNPVVADLAKMPHLLIAGTTGSGKSVAINAMVLSLLYKSSAEHVRLILIDPKMLELSVYEGIPHLLAPVVTDMKHAANALRWCVAEMERRYHLMKELGVRNLAGFNRKVRDAQAAGQAIPDPLIAKLRALGKFEGDIPALQPLPFIVVVIDELADLMLIVGKKVEELIARLAQKARASGIHLVLATQRPSVDVITGPHQGEHPDAHRVPGVGEGRLAHHPRPERRRVAARPRRHAVPAAGHLDAGSRAWRLRLRPRSARRRQFAEGRDRARLRRRSADGPAGEHPGPAGRAGRGRQRRRQRGRGTGPALRRGRAHRHRVAPRFRFGRAAPAQDRLQPRGAPRRIDGSGGPRRPAAVERQPRSARAAAAGIVDAPRRPRLRRGAPALGRDWPTRPPTPARRRASKRRCKGLSSFRAEFRQTVTNAPAS